MACRPEQARVGDADTVEDRIDAVRDAGAAGLRAREHRLAGHGLDVVFEGQRIRDVRALAPEPSEVALVRRVLAAALDLAPVSTAASGVDP